MSDTLEQLAARHGDKVRDLLNYLVESPYFYKTDNETLFYFLNRHKRVFEKFYEQLYGWKLHLDGKCARVYKDQWHNKAITPANRDIFDFTRRDEAIAFMALLEFFEKQIDEQAMSVDEKQNLRFRYGDLLEYTHRRFHELFGSDTKYTGEYVRARALGPIMPKLERFRFLDKVPVPPDEMVGGDDTIYEALPALYHYNTTALSQYIANAEKDA